MVATVTNNTPEGPMPMQTTRPAPYELVRTPVHASGYPDLNRSHTLARFLHKGDAVAAARGMYLGEQLPKQTPPNVYEVLKRGKQVYRAG